MSGETADPTVRARLGSIKAALCIRCGEPADENCGVHVDEGWIPACTGCANHVCQGVAMILSGKTEEGEALLKIETRAGQDSVGDTTDATFPVEQEKVAGG